MAPVYWPAARRRQSKAPQKQTSQVLSARFNHVLMFWLDKSASLCMWPLPGTDLNIASKEAREVEYNSTNFENIRQIF